MHVVTRIGCKSLCSSFVSTHTPTLSLRSIRSCYDLEMHSKKTGVAMLASCKLDEPKMVTEYKLQIDRKSLGKTFKAEQKKVG